MMAEDILGKVKKFCSEELGLKVSEEKTKITNSYKDKILFLGTHIRHAKIYVYGKGSGGVKKRITKRLLLTVPMNRIKAKLTAAGFLKHGLAQTRIS